MSRPTKCRRICELPRTTEFSPSCPRAEDAVIMTVDEFESIRLIDLEGLAQDEAALRMNIARTTAQAIYGNARKKLAEALVHGKTLRIEGGAFEVCGAKSGCPLKENCPRHAGCTQSGE